MLGNEFYLFIYLGAFVYLLVLGEQSNYAENTRTLKQNIVL